MLKCCASGSPGASSNSRLLRDFQLTFGRFFGEVKARCLVGLLFAVGCVVQLEIELSSLGEEHARTGREFVLREARAPNW
jgi:hypothetical protein